MPPMPMSAATTPCYDEVLPGQVWIGNLGAAQALPTLGLGITHVLSVCPDHPAGEDDACHMCVPVQDNEYADLLVHLPAACAFIQGALDAGGRVLVHCVMGVSRSATVVAAYLMFSRHLTSSAALVFVKAVRPAIHPNYGFVTQLAAFAACAYTPAPMQPAYRAWKRRARRDVAAYLGALGDTVSVAPRVFLTTDLPADPLQAAALLADIDITHLLTLPSSPAGRPPGTDAVQCRTFAAPGPLALLLLLPDAVAFIARAVRNGGTVLVHAPQAHEVRACVVVGAYLMATAHLTPAGAAASLASALPLLAAAPPATLARVLALYDATGRAPRVEHPAVQAWVAACPGVAVGVSLFAIGTGADAVAGRPRRASATIAAAAVAGTLRASAFDMAPLVEALPQVQTGIATQG